ncbi:hypothetical protein [Mesorhizobium marinum]|uniref:Uncharacterized protein n=1 Tax=Mesorhizobium marinum TaxID=3228790 RepID=A0ABV3QYW3_9HYPH
MTKARVIAIADRATPTALQLIAATHIALLVAFLSALANVSRLVQP